MPPRTAVRSPSVSSWLATSGFLRKLGADPVTYGEGLADQVRVLAPEGVTAAADLVGTDTALAAVELGVSPGRIATIATASPPDGARATGGRDATPRRSNASRRRSLPGKSSCRSPRRSRSSRVVADV